MDIPANHTMDSLTHIRDIPPPRPKVVTIYAALQALEWAHILELFLYPPGSKTHDKLLIKVLDIGRTTMLLVEIPEADVVDALALAFYLGLQSHSGVPVVGCSCPPTRNTRSHVIFPGVALLPESDNWTDTRIQGAMSAVGIGTTASWIARFWGNSHDSPAITVDIAEWAIRNWLSGAGRLPDVFTVPSS